MSIPIMHPNVHEVFPDITALVRQLRAQDRGQYLYRGQNGLFGPDGNYARQIPSVFRGRSTKRQANAALRASHLRVAWL